MRLCQSQDINKAGLTERRVNHQMRFIEFDEVRDEHWRREDFVDWESFFGNELEDFRDESFDAWVEVFFEANFHFLDFVVNRDDVSIGLVVHERGITVE